MAAAWWGTRENVSERLQIEFEAMRAQFGTTFSLTPPKWGTLLYWTGIIEVNLKGVQPRDHKIKILYPNDFPYRPPEAYVLEPKIYSQKHQFEDGQLCLFNPKDGERYGWNPSRSTAATIAGWAIQWLYAYYTWRATGQWPGVEERVTGQR